jgi:hypothetical protein
MEDALKEVLAAAQAVAEDGELVDDEYYAVMVSPSLMDNLRNALERMNEDA